jgi:hypothetical protein
MSQLPKPATHAVALQLPEVQVYDATLGSEHRRPQAPQLLMSDVSVAHTPEQLV